MMWNTMAEDGERKFGPGVDLYGAPGLVPRWQEAGSVAAAFLFETDGERIHSIFSIANPDKLSALGRVLREGNATTDTSDNGALS